MHKSIPPYVVVALLFPHVLHAQPAPDPLAQARIAAAEEQRLAPQLVAAAAKLRLVETELADQAATVETLSARRDDAAAQLARRGAALAPLLPLVERLALFPAETLLAVPAAPEQAIQGLVILRGLARRLEADAAALQSERARLDAESRAVDAALGRLHAVEAAAASEARALDARIAELQATRQHAEAAGRLASQRAAQEAARADTLRNAVTTLETARARAEAQAREDAARAEQRRQATAAAEARERQDTLARPAGPGPEPRNQLVPPVAGAVLRNWGEPTDAGPANGVSYRPGSQARVVAPCAGRVRFAGPFRSYGGLLILDCGGGYAFVLAGLGRVDVAVGVAVLAGEPVGIMPAWDTGARPALYVELRRDGQAVNPALFLRARG